MYNVFYPPKARSPITELAAQLEIDGDTIELINGDVLPDAPNKVTLGGGEDSETVYYGAKDGGTLTDLIRGFDPPGSEKMWPAGTKAARVLTAQDISAIHNAHEEHLANHDDPHEYEDVSDHEDYDGVKYKLVVEEGVPYLEVTES